jgi:Flp pilus assembly protein TadD
VRTLQSIQYSGPPEREIDESALLESCFSTMQFRILAAELPLWLLLCAAFAMPARAATAEELSEVTRLHRAGQSVAALERAERVLSAQPKDAQMRFLKSVILVDMGRTAEAQSILQALVQDYPELAEPHNNLAAIYVAAGDYGKSRAELEETIRLNPSYAPAHENLGDVHALLAAQSYARAHRLEPASATLPRKLALVRQLPAISSEPKAAPPQPAATASPVRR